MKPRIILTLVLLLGLSVTATAQFRSVSGSLVDQNNKPIEGAKVAVPFTSKHAVTDQDGHFKIPVMKMPKRVRVSKKGYSVALLDAEENMYIRLTSKAMAGWQPDDWHPFVGLDMGFFFSEGGTNGVYASQRGGVTTRSIGLVAGITDSRMGAYLKSHFITLNDGGDDFEIASRRDVRDVIVGGMLNVWNPIFVNAGIGAMFFTERTSNISTFTVVDGYNDVKKKKAVVDVGLSGRYQRYQLSGGVLTTFQRYGWHPYIGVGYLF
ncbi:MAG: carboxypeptidase-like regulatory domain-containing protein [Prevotella sp.]|nr:carboxypeptidase-like regulatory domain-containing protein [Prevotella sp.]